MLRLTSSDRAVAEIAGVAEHVASLTAAAAGLRLVPTPVAEEPHARPVVSLLDEASTEGVAITWREIRAWSRASLARDEIPDFWRALAHQPKLLEVTWRKDRVIMTSGVVDDIVKTYAALAVSHFRQSAYWIDYYTQVLRTRAGIDDAALVEIVGAVMHFVSFNTIAHGMRLEAPMTGITAKDFVPGGALEHVVPGVRRRVPPPDSGGDAR